MGRDSDWPLNLAPVTSLPLSIGSEEEVMALVRDSNPTLRGIEQQVKILEQGIRIEKAAHLPTVNLNTTYGKSHRDFPPQDKNWSIVGVLDFKVFDGGLQTAKVREAHKRLEEGRALLRKTRQSLQNQVKNALRDYQTAQERVQVSGKGFELATEELRLSRLRTDEGLITLTDHLDNQAEYTRAQMTHIIAQFDVLLSQVRLYKLSGQLDDNFVFHLAPVQENVETKEEAIQ
jgi:outer membrane protein